jgi:anaerobic magnesium-protoporphyrin IX monomethyl ester cyclase
MCLVHTPCAQLRDDRLEPPLGLLYLATVARDRGYRIELIDLSARSPTQLGQLIPDGHDVYGFSTYSVNYGLTLELAATVRRRNPRAILIAGGPHATALPGGVAQDGFDVVVTGEGEVATLGILNTLSAGGRPPRIVTGEPKEALDELPFPDYDFIDLETYTREVDGHRSVSILTSRGCPYPCSFCNSNIMGAGKPIRFRTPQNIVAEIRQIKRRRGIRHFRIQDDIFTLSVKRIRELVPALTSENIVYRCFARVNTMSPEMASLLKESGCVHASFGVESGSPKLLSKHAMHKGQTREQIRWALENGHNAGIRSRIFLIVGFPGETDETIEETLDLVKQCPWDEFAVYPLIAYPGTPLHERPEDFGITYIDRNYSDYLQIGRNFRAGFTIRTREFDEDKVRRWRDYVIDQLLADGRTWAGDSPKFK